MSRYTAKRTTLAALSVVASIASASRLLSASPVDPRRPTVLSARETPLPSEAAQDAPFRTLRVKWEQRLPLGGPMVSIGDGIVVGSRTGVHVIDAAGHESTRVSIDPAPVALTLLGDGRVLSQNGSQFQGICLPISACKTSYVAQTPTAIGPALPAVPFPGGGALVATGRELLALDGDGRTWGTADMGGVVTHLFPGSKAGYPGTALAIVDTSTGSRVRSFHPSRGTQTIADVDGLVTTAALSGRNLYVAIGGSTLAQVDGDLKTATPLQQLPLGIHALGALPDGGVAALVGSLSGYALLLTTPRGSRLLPLEAVPNLDGGVPPVGLGYAAIASDSRGFVAVLTPSGALSMLTPEGTILRFPERPCGTDRLAHPPVLAAMPGIGLVLGCPSGRTIAFVSE